MHWAGEILKYIAAAIVALQVIGFIVAFIVWRAVRRHVRGPSQ